MLAVATQLLRILGLMCTILMLYHSLCDYVFNETVVVMSHSNIKRSWTVLKDYFVMFTMLQLAGVTTAEDIKKITLLNIDSLVQACFLFNNDLDDESKAFFYLYHALFRRVLRASQFPKVRYASGGWCG